MSPEEKAALEKSMKERQQAMSKNKELNDAFNAGMDALKTQQYEPAVAALQMAGKTKKPIVYVVRSGLPQPWAEVSKTILAAIKHSPDWQEIPLDNNFGKLGPIEIHKFHRASK